MPLRAPRLSTLSDLQVRPSSAAPSPHRGGRGLCMGGCRPRSELPRPPGGSGCLAARGDHLRPDGHGTLETAASLQSPLSVTLPLPSPYLLFLFPRLFRPFGVARSLSSRPEGLSAQAGGALASRPGLRFRPLRHGAMRRAGDVYPPRGHSALATGSGGERSPSVPGSPASEGAAA